MEYINNSNAEFDSKLVKVVQKNNKHFCVSITKNINFWESVESSVWEPDTFRIFDYFISDNCYYLDIGAWIGPTVLYAAQLAKYTYAFEPDPVSYQELEVNVRTNKNAEWVSRITLYNKAIASSNGTVRLGSRHGGGDSLSSVLLMDKKAAWDVEAITLEQFVELEKIQNEKLFIKMDIEGGEYEVISKLQPAFCRYNIVLFLSLHPHLLVDSLSQSKSNNKLTKILRRLSFVWYHIRLIKSLPFKYFYHSDGKRQNLHTEILRALLTGSFTREIVATNKRWENV